MLQDINTAVTEVVGKSTPIADAKSLEARLENLVAEIQDFKSTFKENTSPVRGHRPPPSPSPPRKQLQSPELPYDLHKDNSLSGDELSSVADFGTFRETRHCPRTVVSADSRCCQGPTCTENLWPQNNYNDYE